MAKRNSTEPWLSDPLPAAEEESEVVPEEGAADTTSPLRLMVVDADEIFRLGLRLWLNQFAELQVVAEASSEVEAFAILAGEELTPSPTAIEDTETIMTAPAVDVVIVERQAWAEAIKAEYPALPVLLLTSQTELRLLTAAFHAGVNGYCPKGTAIAEVVSMIHQLAAGQSVWSADVSVAVPYQSGSDLISGQSNRLASPLPNDPTPLRGRQLIDATVEAITAQLQEPSLSWLDRAFLAGQRRELLASRWLVNRLLPAPSPGVVVLGNQPLPPTPGTDAQEAVTPPVTSAPPPSGLIPVEFRTLKARLFDGVSEKLQRNLSNATETPLEIDILKFEKKQELFLIILKKLEQILDELRFSQVTPTQIIEKRSIILQDLWEAAIADFFGRYYTLQVTRSSGVAIAQDVEVVSTLLHDRAVVKADMLDKLPFVVEFLNCLLFQYPLVIDSQVYPANSFEALVRAEALLDNLVIQVANAVVQPLLNHFPDVEVIKQNFYDRRLISTREIERFRNTLSWKYRLRKYIHEPQEIFESQFQLLVFGDRGIQKTSIYASRSQELAQLSGVQLAVTLALETRDAIAPPLRAAVAFCGKGLVYVLTQVIGRGIGLVGRGIIQGVGTSWQDSRFSRKRSQSKE